jgi:hypothetical protein
MLPGHFRCKKTTGIAGGYVFSIFLSQSLVFLIQLRDKIEQ